MVHHKDNRIKELIGKQRELIGKEYREECHKKKNEKHNAMNGMNPWIASLQQQLKRKERQIEELRKLNREYESKWQDAVRKKKKYKEHCRKLLQPQADDYEEEKARPLTRFGSGSSSDV